MGKTRSPNCPTISLQEALDKGRRVYTEEHTHAADRKVIAEDLGYSGLSGSSATIIGILRQYGILEGRGEGMHVSDDAVSAFELPKDSPDHIAALRRMALRPTLFTELHEQFGDRLPGEANLRHLLIKKGFLPDTADNVIRTYRENLELVGGHAAEYNKPIDELINTDAKDRLEMKDSVAVSLNATSGRNTRIFSWPLSKDIVVEVRFSGAGELSSGHFERLRKYLELAKETWSDEDSEG